jgi:mono/diheme cytochrome c family protein
VLAAVLALVSGTCTGRAKAPPSERNLKSGETRDLQSASGNEKSAAGKTEPSEAPPGKQEGSPSAAAPPDKVKDGRALFQGSCSSCHAPDAKGIKGLGSDLATSNFVKSKTDAELLDFVKVGRRATDPANQSRVEMPARGGNPALTDDNIRDIILFLRSISRK